MQELATVYHGSVDIIKKPVCSFGRKNLDFGRGFYVTNIREQAESWAASTQRFRDGKACVNVYTLNIKMCFSDFRTKVFDAYDREWLDFIVSCRNGYDAAAHFDLIEGGIANDRVIDTVNNYIGGLIPVEVALSKLSQQRPNNQICILNQELVDKYLCYEQTYYL